MANKERLALVLESLDTRLCRIEELLAKGIEHDEQVRQSLHKLNNVTATLVLDVATDLAEIKKIQRELGPLLDKARGGF